VRCTETHAKARSVTDLRDWLRDDRVIGYQPHTIYLTATGVTNALSEYSSGEHRREVRF